MAVDIVEVKAGQGLKILLAEDNPYNQELAEIVLTQKGYEVAVVSNGLAAVEAFVQSDFDLILMDLHMPEMDGLQATRLIRAKEKDLGGHIPIVAMTASDWEEQRADCLAAGMDDFVSKPFDSGELVRIISDQGLAVIQAKPTEAKVPNWDEIIDMEALLAIVNGDRGILRELVDLFLVDLERRISEIREAIYSDNSRQLVQAAHAIKGTSSTYAAMAVTQAARGLQELGESGDLTLADEALVGLEHEVRLLKEALANFFQKADPQEKS